MISLSTHLFVFYELDRKVVEKIGEWGFDDVEIWGTLPHFHYDDDRYLEEILAVLTGEGVKVASFHAPFYTRLVDRKPVDWFSLSDCDSAGWRRGVDEIKRFIDSIARFKGVSHIPVPVVLHTGFNRKDDVKCQYEMLHRALDVLIGYIRGSQFVWALENGTSGLDGPGAVADIVTSFSSPFLRMCLDVGHANITEEDWLAELHQYVDMVADFHVHDNSGERDEHLPPGSGSIDFDRFFNIAGRSRLFTMELMDYGRGDDWDEVVAPAEKSIYFLKKVGLWKRNIDS